MKKSFLDVSCSGSFYELGQDQGEFLRDQIPDIFKTLLTSEYVPALVRLAGPQFLKLVFNLQGASLRFPVVAAFKKQLPRQWERLCGLAKGLGVSVHTLIGIARIETTAAQFHFVMGCLSMAVAKEHSQNSSPLIAYNHDFPKMFRDQILVRRSNPQDGYASIQMTYPLLAGAIAGINQKGVAVTLNHAYSQEPLGYFDTGIPPSWVVQEILDLCDSVDDAISIARNIRFGCGSLMTIMDRHGGMCVLEFSQNKFGVRKSQDNFLLTLNAYQLKDLQTIEIPQEAKFDMKKTPKSFEGLFIHEHNWQRQKRCDDLSVNTKAWTLSELKDFLSDHNGMDTGSEGTICRHHPTSDTIASVILHPQEISMEISRGHACQAEYQKFFVK